MKQYTPEEIALMPASTRRWLRLKGYDIPKRSPGPRKGYKQTAEHIEKRKRKGAAHHLWKGERVSERGGRTRALRMYQNIGPCVLCGDPDAERHHIDGSTANNEEGNILIICRRCHMHHDGRIEQFRQLAIINQPKAVAARWR